VDGAAVSKPRLDLDDIQGLIARGYGGLRFAAFLLLAVEDPAAAGGTLAGWAAEVTTAARKPGEVALNVALTAAGIEALAPGVAGSAGFSEQFTSGMTTDYRSRLLGDTEDDDPRGWDWGAPGSDAVHVLLLVYADTADRLAARCAELTTEAGSGGLRLLHQLPTSELTLNENFGFHDGISQPPIEGLGTGPAAGQVKAGEFVLGYPNEYGLLTDRPLLPPGDDPAGLLPRAAGTGAPDLGRNGSYLVLRTLRQDVGAFHAFTEAATRDAAGRPDPDRQALLGAKMVGRWPSGAPLSLAPAHDDASLADSNDFAYQANDPRGLACPIGSHVRRTNPRDSLEPQPGTEASLAINRRHRLLRRGRSYGSPDGGECGVHFIVLNANLARQYEFVQHTWVNNPVFNQLENETDPLVGTRRAKRSYFTTPARPARRRYAELPQFVHVRGGAYFFLPGIRALRFLAGARSSTT
jgi:Dyp-type peroxidase family